MQIRTTVLIPCYDEADGIPHLCSRLRELVRELSVTGPVEVLFVDDGSTDGTQERIRESAAGLPVRIVTHESNRGLGAALKTGLEAAYGAEILTLDSDCTYDPLQGLQLLDVLRQGYDVVTGSPYHPMGQVVDIKEWRLILSKSLSYLYWLVLPVRLYTYTSLFRAYRKDVLLHIVSGESGFLAVTQLLVSAIVKGYRVAEVPATLSSRKFGQSKIRVIRESLAHIGFLLKIPFMRATMRDKSQMLYCCLPIPGEESWCPDLCHKRVGECDNEAAK